MSDNKSTLDAITKMWEHTSLAGRFSVVIGVVSAVAVLVGVAWWALSPNYVPLANGLSPQEAAEVISLLEAEGIACKRNYNGKGILVDQTKWGQANSAIANIVDQTQIESGGMNSGLLLDPSSRDHRMTRDLESRLEKTISQLAQVVSARVHLGLPEREVFARHQGQTTASVVVQLRPGTSLNRKLATTVATTVARSVEGLSRENISLSDTSGNIFSFDDDSIGGAIANQMEYRKKYEEDLIISAETMLEKLLGPGKAIVRISADMDFTSATIIETTLDPDSKVATKEETHTAEGTTEDPLASGVVGTPTNLASARIGAGATDTAMKSEVSKSDFYFGSTEKTLTQHPGAIRRLTIAAMVNLQPDDAAAADGTTQTIPTPDEIKEIIKSAVGFDAARNDEISVVQFSGAAAAELALEEETPTASPLDTMMPNILKGVLAFAAVIAMLIGWLTMRKVKPIELGTDEQAALSPQRARQLSELSVLARNNPELFKSILMAWTGQDAEPGVDRAAGKAA